MSFNNAMVIGSSGQVSRALLRALHGKYVLFTSSSGANGAIAMDLASEHSIASGFAQSLEKFNGAPAEVFLAGAMTHVDRCEQDKARCQAINEVGPAVVAAHCKRHHFGLTYFSTEYVFGEEEYRGGKVGPFNEMDVPSPSSFYGQCKRNAELAVEKELGFDALIARTTMVYSWDEQGMNFLMQYIRQLESLKQGEAKSFRIPVDQISTPAYAPDLAQAVVNLREQSMGGIYNLVGPDLLSRKEIVELVAKEFSLGNAEQAFSFVTTAALGQAARRPLTAGLTGAKARDAGIRMRSLREAFAEIKELRKS